MYASVRFYEMSEEWDEVLMGHLNEGFLPKLEAVPGFVAYYSLEAGPRLFASISLFRDRSSAQESDRLAADYVKLHLADRFPTSPEVTAGEVKAFRAP